MCELNHSTKRLWFFDYLGEECEVPESYYIEQKPADYSRHNIYKMIDMKKREYGL